MESDDEADDGASSPRRCLFTRDLKEYTGNRLGQGISLFGPEKKKNMFSQSEPSCSDCKLEMVKKRWTELLVNWINKCVNPLKHIKEPTKRSLVEIINKYKHDICSTDIDRAMLCTDDLEPFLIYKYPMLRLRYFTEDKDTSKKIYIMMSMLLYHCVVSSIGGQVVNDICKLLDPDEQEMVLRFCENLTLMETTINNVDRSIHDACVTTPLALGKTRDRLRQLSTVKIGDGHPEHAAGKHDTVRQRKALISSVTVMQSAKDSTDYSKSSLQPESSETETDYTESCVSSKFDNDSTEVNTVYNIRNALTDLKELKEQSDSEKGEPGKEKERTIAFNLPELFQDSYETKNKVQQCRCRSVLFTCVYCGRVEIKFCDYLEPACKEDCACTRCSSEVCCGVPGTRVDCDSPVKEGANDGGTDKLKLLVQTLWSWKFYIFLATFVVIVLILIIGFSLHYFKDGNGSRKPKWHMEVLAAERRPRSRIEPGPDWSWQCIGNRCESIPRHPKHENNSYNCLSRCYLLCTGPQLWPQPIGLTRFSKKLVALATNRLEYKFQTVPSEIVNQYLAEAFKLFLGDLARLERIDVRNQEKNISSDLPLKKLYIQIDVETDPDPRLRLNTDEAYYLKVDSTENQVKAVISSASFCGVRHGLETLSQLILYDQATGKLVTLSNSIVKDAPSYKYRGLMIDTGRNFIPVSDLMRTVDAMATCKLNTFHWRISDATSFPLSLPTLANLFEYGAYDRSMLYTKEDIKSIVRRAGVRGIRVLIEVAVPGPVGRAWSWSDDATCPKKNNNITCENVLCLRLKMKEDVFQILQHIYSEIIDMTEIDDVFHMSDGVFSFSNCYFLLEDRAGFLDKALHRLKLANKGFLPKLPIVWFSGHLMKDFEARSWERLGVQLTHWNPTLLEQSLSKFRVIHSGKWILSCETKKLRCVKYRTWQEMYSWKGWSNVEVFSTEGGEAVLWTDLVDGGNLDYTLWPRTAAVAERLWSDLVINKTVSDGVYVRLDSHRLRMSLRGIKVPPIWPAWCSFNPSVCLAKLNKNNR